MRRNSKERVVVVVVKKGVLISGFVVTEKDGPS